MLGIGRRPAVSEHQELVPRSERLVNHVGRALNRLDVRTVGNRGHVRRDLQKQLREFWSHGATTSITLLKFPSARAPTSVSSTRGRYPPRPLLVYRHGAAGTAGERRARGGVRGGRERELGDDIVKLGNRLAAVDTDSELRAAVESLRIPAAECPDLVDHPALATSSGWWLAIGGQPIVRTGGDVTEPLRFVDALVEQQLNVIE